MTCDASPMTHDMWGEVNLLSKFPLLALTVWEWRSSEDISTKDHWLNWWDTKVFVEQPRLHYGHSIWAQDCLNNIFDVGCIDDNFVWLHLGTQNATVAIKKTCHWITKRVNIKIIINREGYLEAFNALHQLTSLLKKYTEGQNCYTWIRVWYKFLPSLW